MKASKQRAAQRRQVKKSVKRVKKSYRPKRLTPLYMLSTDIQASRRIMMTLFLRIEEHLPKGDLDREDLMDLVMLFNHIQVGIFNRKDSLDPEGLKEFSAVLEPALSALKSLLERYYRINKIVCTGEELQKILTAVPAISDFVFESLDVCPKAFSREGLAALYLHDKDAWPDLNEKSGKESLRRFLAG